MFKPMVMTAMLGLALMLPLSFAQQSPEDMLNPITFKQSMDGLLTKDEMIGVGQKAKSGDSVKVHYVGVLYPSMKLFDSSRGREPFEFRLGYKEVIPGWDKGVLGMQPGGKRLLIIPPSLAYGPKGAGDAIPPNATLLFEVEVLEVKEGVSPKKRLQGRRAKKL